jgi:ABC-type cobalamin/Fe3+-siderophores transport system ATPase subunit
MKFTSTQLGNRQIELSRVTVILGANGSGKSSVLAEALQNVGNICPGKKAVYVEGGRAINLQNTLQLTRQNFNQYQDYKRAKSTYEGKRQLKLSDRVYDALMVLERKELAIKAKHSDDVEKWYEAGQESVYPIRETPPLERLFSLFHEIFPRLCIVYDPDAKIIKVRKGTAEYSISEMSDGEKQCFSILADFVELGDEYRLIIVDEPELNLHPELADRIWNLIEAEFPGKIYCYATHSLSFAMRSQVERVIVLSDDPENITIIEDPSDFSKIQLTEFLGSIPGIIAAKNVVVSEGEEKSFDSVFYRWVLSDEQIEVMAAGDCEQVINVCKRDGIWSRIAPKVILTGVVDRDFRENPVANEVILKFREAESYLAIPTLALLADSHLKIVETRITADEIIDMIIKQLAQERYLIGANLVASKCGMRLGVSIARSVKRSCDTTETLIKHLKQSSQEELSKAACAMGNDKIEGMITELNKTIDKALKVRDWTFALKVIDGKAIGNAVAKQIGIRNAIDLMRSISTNIKPELVEEIKQLSASLIEKIPKISQ